MKIDGSLLLSAALLALPAAALAETPKRTVVNRVLAVVSDEPITQVEVSKRLVTELRVLASSPEKERAAAEAKLRGELLQRLIEERVIELRSKELRIVVESSEIDRAMKLVADGLKLKVEELLDAVRKAGLTEAEYRQELSRQLLRAKVMRFDVWDTVPKNAAGEVDREKLASAEKAHMEKLVREASVEVMP